MKTELVKAAEEFRAHIVVDDDQQLVSVRVPKDARVPRSFISRCHYEAGELGYGIRFVEI